MNQRQSSLIDYLREENGVLREQLGGKRLDFNDDQRRRLAAKAKILGRKVLVALGTIGLNPKLTIGTANQSVTVEAAPPMLHTDDATLGSSMENEIYAALPLQMNGVPRDPTQFVSLVPGVNTASTGRAQAGTGPPYDLAGDPFLDLNNNRISQSSTELSYA